MLFAELENAAEELESGEFEITKRSGQATIQWRGPFTVRGALQAGRGKKGLYVIYRNGKVVDSGKTEAQDLSVRLAQHFEYPLRHGEDLNNYRISLGIVSRSGSVNLGEGIVTRSLAKAGHIPLRRKSLDTGKMQRVPNTSAFQAVNRGVRITHKGAVPKELGLTKTKGRAVQTFKRGTIFEFLPPHLWSEAALEQALGTTAAELEATLMGEMGNAAAKRWHYWDAWGWSGTAWSNLETMGPIMDTYENGEQIRMTLLLKWQARLPGKQILARCFSWNGSQWLDCRNHRY